MRSSRTESFDTTIAGRDACIEFTRVTTWSHDPSYGSDADGNRGIPMDFLDDDEAEDITLNFDDEPAKPLVEWPYVVRDLVDKAIEHYLEENKPQGGDDDRDEVYERAAARARSNNFKDTGGKDWT